jgi:hypothetical protein
MSVPSKSIRIRWTWLLTFPAIAAGALALSFSAGNDAVRSCLSALIVSGIAGCISLILIAYAVAYKPHNLTIYTLAAGTVRLLLMILGSAIILILDIVNALWFVVWLGVFYSVILVFEMRFAFQAANINVFAGAGKS